MKTMNNKALIAAAVASVALIATLAVLLVKSNSEKEEMTQVFAEEKEALQGQYNDLFVEYDDLTTDNDSLNRKLNEERERVAQLSEELKTLKASNARRIKELQGELTTLRTVMRSFIVQIDSLNQKNVELTKENKEMRNKIADVSRQNASLAERNDDLSKKVSVAARLEARSIAVTTLNQKDKKTSSLKKVTKIRVDFTLAKNVSASVGMKDVFVRISRPDGQLLMHSASDTFSYEDGKLNFSAHRLIEYGGEDTQAAIFYNVDLGELMEGKYDIELFCEGERIGQATAEL